MGDVILLLRPKWLSAINASRDRKDRFKGLALAGLVLLACLGVFTATHHVLNYIKELYVGPGLELMELRFEINRRLLGMAILTFLAVLIFSNIITALTTFFLSADLTLVFAAPVSLDSIFLARFIEMTVDSSWMVIVFGTPVYVAFGVVYDASLWYYLSIPFLVLPFILIPAGIGLIVTMALVSAFPARRIRDLLFILAVIAAGLLFMLLRMLQPEKLANPDATLEVLDFIATLQAPLKSWMPNYWLTEALARQAKGGLGQEGWLEIAMLWSFGLGAVAAALLFARGFYWESYSKSQEATRIRISKTGLVNRLVRLVASPFSLTLKQMVMKDLRVFMRDATQWSQLFLLAALVTIYIFNIWALPISRFPMEKLLLQNVISYANIGFAGFVLAALAARFVFPMVSLEGQAFWIVKTSPLSLKGFLWSKFLISAVPLAIIGEVLVVVSNHLLQVSPIVRYVGMVTILLMTVAICGLGVGLGARYPKFHVENPAKVATSFGGVFYMVTALAAIAAVVALEATPTYIYLNASYRKIDITAGQYALIAACFAAAALVLIVTAAVPMRIGEKWLEDLEVH